MFDEVVVRGLSTIGVVFVVGASFAAFPAMAADESAEAKARFFETEVRPLLAARCFECHGPQRQWSGLRLDSRESLIKGGDSGEAVVPGRPEESLLIRAVRHELDAPSMPPEDSGEKLSDREIAKLTRWVAAGAIYPSKSRPNLDNAGANHWAFQAPTDPAVPEVKDGSWPRSALDRFVLVKLEAEGIRPAAPADPRTLLRRVTFDLTGLPPTPEELEAYFADDRPDAYERLIDRLLASPAYGERWGRHWLDVARYADSNGLDENIAHGNAWRYRDYVIAAFNSDKAYDRFVTEQLAGDLLDADDESVRRENLIATGFLVLGPKVLAEVDETKMEMDIIDEQVDTVGRAFIGMTFGCARCHDHKFDPISAADYYGLAGIFKSTRTMETFTKIARWHENALPSDESRSLLAAYEQRKTEAKSALDALVAAADAQLVASGMAVPATPNERNALYPDETKATLERLRKEFTVIEKSPPELPSAMGATERTVADVAIHLRGSHHKIGEVVPRRVPAVFASPQPAFSSKQSGRLELARWLVDPDHPLTSRVIVNRVWRWHFGHGLVRTPDNFGLLGQTPSHPELLDWLAHRFVDDGWSIKELHRTILLSSTYRQSDIADPNVAERDPENRLFGRMAVRRLEAEAVRDALLATSDRLDRTMGGSSITVKNREFFFDHTSKDGTTYTSRRRSLYLPIVRNNVYAVLSLLDFPDPAVSNGDRTTTTVAPQALLMMNSDLVAESAASLAESVCADAKVHDAERIHQLYRIAYARDATTQEVTANLAFLREVEGALNSGDASAWSALCQVVLSANEFIHVR